MVFVCHVISKDHLIKRWFRKTTWSKGYVTLWVGVPHRKSPPAKYGAHRHCGSGDIMVLVAEDKDSRCSCFNSHYCLSVKDMAWSNTAYINNSDPGLTRIKQQVEKNLKITFASPSRKSEEKEKEKKNWNGNCKAFLRYTQTQKVIPKMLIPLFSL